MKLIITKRRRGWYWRLVAANGRTVAIGGEPFSSARTARRSFNDLHAALFWSEPTGQHKRVSYSEKPIRVEVRRG